MTQPDPTLPPDVALPGYAVALALAILILLAASIGNALDPSPVSRPAAEGTGRADWRAARAPLTVESLTCFTCHSMQTYASGGEGAFPHLDHFEFLETQDCHLCHAFAGHDVVINRTPCGDCH